MSKSFELGKILFLDIETVPVTPNYSELSPNLQELWRRKAKSIYGIPEEALSEEQLQESFRDKAGISAEFGKIVCLSVGFAYLDKETAQYRVRLKSFCGESEGEILRSFCDLIQKHYGNPAVHALCGHNIREFDLPFICRRLIIHHLPVPEMFQVSGKKPWEYSLP
jgi:uncharacterized protein YprB with RNaseH-like and TPR domain